MARPKDPRIYWNVPPTAAVEVKGPLRSEVLEFTRAALADPQLRLLMGSKVLSLLGRLESAPTRDRMFERVPFASIRPVAYEGARPGWYLDEISGLLVVFEDEADPPYWSRETPFPAGAFTAGELAALEAELWSAAGRLADATTTLTPTQRQAAIGVVEAADDVDLRVTMMNLHLPREEEEAIKRTILELLGREENPPMASRLGCEVMAPHVYVSPQERRLSPRERKTREIAYSLKRPFDSAIALAAPELARYVGEGDVLIPIPDHAGSSRANRKLAEAVARRSGSQVCDALTRRLVVSSSLELRRAGLRMPAVAAHEMLRVSACPTGRYVLVDNIVTSGTTALAAAEALGIPCVVLAWAWHRTFVEELAPASNPAPARLDPKLRVTGASSAVRALEHDAVLRLHELALEAPAKHRVAVLVPCAEKKPYRESRSHALGYLPALEGLEVDVFVVSDLLGVFPYAWSDDYPGNAYEFAPKHVRGEAREILVRRIHAWLRHRGKEYQRIYLALPAHHMRLVLAGTEGLDDLRLYDASISVCREQGACPSSHFRATSSAYVDYLRRAIK